jgi:hypothetical protein
VGRFGKLGQSAKAKTHSMMIFTNGTNKSTTHQPLYPAFPNIFIGGTIELTNTPSTISQ